MKPDDLDLQILNELKKDSNRSVRELSRVLNENASTLYNRIKRLESNSVIERWTIALNYEKLEIDHVVFVFVMIDTNYLDTKNPKQHIIDKIKVVDGISEMHILSGEFDLLLKIRGCCLKSINNRVIDKIRQIQGVSKTVPALSVETVIEECDLECLSVVLEDDSH